jgi:hypothetical protein
MVYGEGRYTAGGYLSKVSGSTTKEYELWKGMLRRCYSEKFHLKNPTYAGCTVEDAWKDFQTFALWCNREVGFNEVGWQLDKDILSKGNTVYSDKTCCFVPKDVNVQTTKARAVRGDLPIGVYQQTDSKKFYTHLHIGGKLKHIGSFCTIESAFAAYKAAKEAYLRELADAFKGRISQSVYVALQAYEVHTND